MKISQRILTDILREKDGEKLYVLDILLDEDGVFELWKYYGNRQATSLTKRKVTSSEHYEVVVSSYNKTLQKKLKKNIFRRLADGEMLVSAALGKLFKPAAPSTNKKKTIPVPYTEHRKLRLS